MPIAYQISADESLATIRVFDRFAEAELLATLETLRTDPDYRLDMHRL